MTRGLSDQLLSQVSECVTSQLGLHFPRARWRDLERGIRSAAREFGTPDAESCARWLLSAPLTKNQIEILASELTVGETYFFREQRSFAILGERILPELLRVRQGAERRLRIWSAGCCTGEEPYSIAILLDRVLPDPRQWHVTILGTDVNPRFLQKAAQGVFGEWSFRDAPAWLKENYFKPVGAQRFEILPRIKAMVTLAYLNLAEDTYPALANNTHTMDLIFCRNVLMYFAAEHAQRVIHQFHRSLVEGGWLIVSPVETSAQLFSLFAPIHFEQAILYRKGTRQLPAPVAPVLEEATPVEAEEALALGERGDYVEAAQKRKADPVARAESVALLARTCANLGQLVEARDWTEKALAADKLDAGLHYLRATILQEQSALEEAVAALKRALYLDPDCVVAHFVLGTLALRQQRGKEAAKHFTNALTLLKRYRDDEVLPQSDGLVAGRFRELIQSTMSMETPT